MGQQVPGTVKSQILSIGVQLLKQPTRTFMLTRTLSTMVIQMIIVNVFASWILSMENPMLIFMVPMAMPFVSTPKFEYLSASGIFVGGVMDKMGFPYPLATLASNMAVVDMVAAWWMRESRLAPTAQLAQTHPRDNDEAIVPAKGLRPEDARPQAGGHEDGGEDGEDHGGGDKVRGSIAGLRRRGNGGVHGSGMAAKESQILMLFRETQSQDDCWRLQAHK